MMMIGLRLKSLGHDAQVINKYLSLDINFRETSLGISTYGIKLQI